MIKYIKKLSIIYTNKFTLRKEFVVYMSYPSVHVKSLLHIYFILCTEITVVAACFAGFKLL